MFFIEIGDYGRAAEQWTQFMEIVSQDQELASQFMLQCEQMEDKEKAYFHSGNSFGEHSGKY